MTAYEEAQRAEAKVIARAIGDYVNNYAHSPDAFTQAMSEEHRTLQQSFTGLCLAWLKHLSELREHQYDPRNEASARIARRIAAPLRDAWGESWHRLPLI